LGAMGRSVPSSRDSRKCGPSRKGHGQAGQDERDEASAIPGPMSASIPAVRLPSTASPRRFMGALQSPVNAFNHKVSAGMAGRGEPNVREIPKRPKRFWRRAIPPPPRNLCRGAWRQTDNKQRVAWGLPLITSRPGSIEHVQSDAGHGPESKRASVAADVKAVHAAIDARRTGQGAWTVSELERSRHKTPLDHQAAGRSRTALNASASALSTDQRLASSRRPANGTTCRRSSSCSSSTPGAGRSGHHGWDARAVDDLVCTRIPNVGSTVLRSEHAPASILQASTGAADAVHAEYRGSRRKPSRGGSGVSSARGACCCRGPDAHSTFRAAYSHVDDALRRRPSSDRHDPAGLSHSRDEDNEAVSRRLLRSDHPARRRPSPAATFSNSGIDPQVIGEIACDRILGQCR